MSDRIAINKTKQHRQYAWEGKYTKNFRLNAWYVKPIGRPKSRRKNIELTFRERGRGNMRWLRIRTCDWLLSAWQWMRDYRLALRCSGGLRSSEMLRSVNWLLLTAFRDSLSVTSSRVKPKMRPIVVGKQLDCVSNVMEHAQKPDFVFRWNGRVHLNRRGRQFSPLLAAEVCASAVIMLDTPYSEVVWRVVATHSIIQCPLHFPSRASPCAITFQLDSTNICSSEKSEGHSIELSGSIKHGFCRNKPLLTSGEFPVPTVKRSKQVSNRLFFYVVSCTAEYWKQRPSLVYFLKVPDISTVW